MAVSDRCTIDRGLGKHLRQHLRCGLEHGDPAAEASERDRHLDTDRSATDDDQMARYVVELEELARW